MVQGQVPGTTRFYLATGPLHQLDDRTYRHHRTCCWCFQSWWWKKNSQDLSWKTGSRSQLWSRHLVEKICFKNVPEFKSTAVATEPSILSKLARFVNAKWKITICKRRQLSVDEANGAIAGYLRGSEKSLNEWETEQRSFLKKWVQSKLKRTLPMFDPSWAKML